MDALAERILDTALDRAQVVGWHDLRLREVAGELGLPLTEVLARFRDQDAIADAHFQRLLAAMIAPPADPAAFAILSPHERAEAVMLRWFEAAAARRAVTIAMIQEKAWPFHPHHWVPMIFNLSRLIHWVRDAAQLDRSGPVRAIEEIGLTDTFLVTLATFALDCSGDLAATRRTLAAALRLVPLG
jgi:AcrR family transcriptional regulator